MFPFDLSYNRVNHPIWTPIIAARFIATTTSKIALEVISTIENHSSFSLMLEVQMASMSYMGS